MDLNKYLNKAALSETQYSKEEYAAMKKTEREAVWVQVDARMGEVLADAPTLQGFLDFMSQCRNSLPNQLLLSGQNADITDARTFQQWKDAGRHIRTGEEGYTAIVGQVYENNAERLPGIISARCSTLHRRAADLCHRPLTTKWMNWSPRPSRAARCQFKSLTACRTVSKRNMFPRIAQFMSATAWTREQRCAPLSGNVRRLTFTRTIPITAKPTLHPATAPRTWSRTDMAWILPRSTLTVWLRCTANWMPYSRKAFCLM